MPRFLPATIGDLLIKYLALVRPAEMDVAVVLQKNGDKYLRTCLFADMDGPWDGPRLRTSFQKYSYEWLGQEWYISEFRQAMAAFFHEHIIHDPARDGYSGTSVVVDAQAGRSVAVGSRRYGNSNDTILSMDPYLLEEFANVSIRWHRLIEQESTIPMTRQFILPVADTLIDSIKDRHQHLISRTISADGLTSALRDFLGNPTAEFKSLFQKDATLSAIKGTDDLLVILPTGAGKSFIYLLPLFLDKTQPISNQLRCTVLICPFISLTQDVLHRCQSFQIYIREYSKSFRVTEHPNLNLLVVRIEDAVTVDFWTQLATLARQGRLARLVFDEAHVALSDVSYRPCFAYISKIRQAMVPWLALTATLAPKDEENLAKSFGIGSFKPIRMPTSRTNIAYHVREYTPVESSSPAYDLTRPIAITAVKSLMNFPRTGSNGKVRDRIIVYCRTVDEVERCKTAIDSAYRTYKPTQPTEICSMYHGRMSDVERKKSFENWREGKAIVMVATKAFGMGVDFPHVRTILHCGPCDSAYDFGQQTGRAGRDGLVATSILFWNKQQFRTIQSPLDERWRDWIINDSTCRRSLLQWALDCDDGRPIHETLPDFMPLSRCRDTTEKCDICANLTLVTDGTDVNLTHASAQGISSLTNANSDAELSVPEVTSTSVPSSIQVPGTTSNLSPAWSSHRRNPGTTNNPRYSPYPTQTTIARSQGVLSMLLIIDATEPSRPTLPRLSTTPPGNGMPISSITNRTL